MKMLSLFSGVGMQALTEIKQLRRKNSQLGGSVTVPQISSTSTCKITIKQATIA